MLALALLLLAAGLAWQRGRAGRAAAEQALLDQAQAVAMVLDLEIAGARRVVEALAPWIAAGPAEADALQARLRAAATAVGATAITLLDTGTPPPAASHRGVVVAVPLPAARPEGARLLALHLPREHLLATLARQRLAPGAYAAAVDPAGLIVAQTWRDAEAMGQPAPLPTGPLPTTAAPAAMLPAGHIILGGTPMVAAQAQAPESGYRVLVGMPEALFEARLNAAQRPMLAFAAAFATAGLLLGRAAARPAPAPPASTAGLPALFQTSTVGVLRGDAGGRVTEANDAFLRIIGMTRTDLEAGRIRWDDLTPPEWIGRDERAIAEALRQGACAPYQKEYVRPDGTHVPVLACFAFDNPATGSSFGFVLDLSDWATTEAALARANDQMRLAIGAARMFFWDFNVVTGLVEWSDGLAEACGLPPGGFAGTVEAFRALVHPEDLPRVEADLGAALAGERDYDTEFRMHHAAGGFRWVVARAIVQRDGTGRPVRMVGIDFDVTDRKRAEAAAAQGEARFRTFAEATLDVVYVLDVQAGRLEYISPSYERVWGDARANILENPERWSELLHPADRERILASRDAFLAAGTAPVRVEYRVVRPSDGAVRYIRDTAVPVRDADGRLLRVAGVAHDDTDRALAEAAVLDGAARFRHLADAMPALVFIASPEGENTYTNLSYQTYAGLDDAALQGYGWTTIVHPEDRSRAEAIWGQAIAGGTAYENEMRLRRHDGTWRWFLVRAVPERDAEGHIFRWLGTCTDIDQHRRTEAALAGAEERQRLAVEAAELGVWTWDLRTGEMTVSPRCCLLYGVAPEEPLDFERLLAAIIPEDRAAMETAVAEALASHGDYDVEHRVALEDGRQRWLRSRGRAGFGPDGAALSLRGVVMDMDAQKRAEAALRGDNDRLEARVAERTRALTLAAAELTAEMRRRELAQAALIEAQKLEALGQLTSGVAHDFNNVLAAVMGSLRLIGKRAADNPRVVELAANGQAAAERAAALVRQLLAFARREDPAPAPRDTAALLAGAEGLLRHAVGGRVQLATAAERDIWPVMTDAHRLEVALLNLAVNARDAMQGTGTLAITACNAPAGEGSAGAEWPPGLRPGIDHVVLAVRDNGAGMAPEVLARAGQAFFTTKPRGQGTGLGLAMVQAFARESGGAVRILSAPGEGTTVELWLPRAVAPPPPPPQAPDAEADLALHGDATILVVDDDDQVRLVTATQLRDLGYVVLEANGAEAAMVQALATPRLDLLLTDVVMPGGDGPDLAARLYARRPGLAVVFMTGYAGGHDLPADRVLIKPFAPPELGRMVLQALGRQPGLPDPLLRRLCQPQMRAAYLAWRDLREGAEGRLPGPDAARLARVLALREAFLVAIEGDDPPSLRFVRVNEGLAERLRRPLLGTVIGADETDGALADVSGEYDRAGRHGMPCFSYVRYRLGDALEPVMFERLLLPLSNGDGRHPTHLLGLVCISGTLEDPAPHS